MAKEGIMRLWSFVAGADLSSNQYYCVDLDTTAAGSQVVVQTTAGGTVIGVLQDKPTSGQSGLVCLDGVTKVVVGTGGFTAGDQVACDGSGKVITATSSKRIIGRALETAAAGDIASIFLHPAAAQS